MQYLQYLGEMEPKIRMQYFILVTHFRECSARRGEIGSQKGQIHRLYGDRTDGIASQIFKRALALLHYIHHYWRPSEFRRIFEMEPV